MCVCPHDSVMRRWGILWRPLQVPLCRVKCIVKCVMILHNLCVDAGCTDGAPTEPPTSHLLRPTAAAATTLREHASNQRQVFNMYRQTEVELESDESIRSHHRAPELQCSKRDELCKVVKEANLRRPERSSYSSIR